MESLVSDHYNSDALTGKIEKALTMAGKEIGRIPPEDLAVIDQLHTGGIRASLATLESAGIVEGVKVLDAGCGIGGTTRLLADRFKCRATGIDLASQFVEAAEFLSRATGLEEKVGFRQGSILDMPFEDQSFDVIVCQHILMNIKDKAKAAQEFSRVLKKGGILILNEITKGDGHGMKYPVPWAFGPEISFLTPWPAMLSLFEAQGFVPDCVSDKSQFAAKWWEKVKTAVQQKASSPSPLNPGLIFGKNAKFFGPHMHHNFEHKIICLVEAVLKKR